MRPFCPSCLHQRIAPAQRHAALCPHTPGQRRRGKGRGSSPISSSGLREQRADVFQGRGLCVAQSAPSWVLSVVSTRSRHRSGFAAAPLGRKSVTAASSGSGSFNLKDELERRPCTAPETGDRPLYAAWCCLCRSGVVWSVDRIFFADCGRSL